MTVYYIVISIINSQYLNYSNKTDEAFMEDINLKRIQQIEYDMLKDIAHFCDQNNIEYFITGGTLLGAIRHGGFIPWDDDIDIGMDLKNYKKFLRIARDSFPKKYFIQNFKTEKKYNYAWTKIRLNGTTFMDARMTNFEIHSGVFIDIFLYNGISDNKICRITQTIAARIQRVLLRKFYYLECDVTNPHSNAIYYILPEFLRRGLIYILDHIVNVDCTKTRWCYDTYYATVGKECKYRSKWFKNLKKVRFRDEYFLAPNDPEAWLESKYGDWQTLPPESERIGHGDTIFDSNKDYTFYYGEKLKRKLNK